MLIEELKDDEPKFLIKTVSHSIPQNGIERETIKLRR
jgi:hypothetical protein